MPLEKARYDGVCPALLRGNRPDRIGIRIRDRRREAARDNCKSRRSRDACTVTQPTSNRAPTISGTPASSATTDLSYSFTPAASDPDGNTLTFAIVNRPAWASFSTSTGRLAGTPSSASVGEYNRRVALEALMVFCELNGATIDAKILDERKLELMTKKAASHRDDGVAPDEWVAYEYAKVRRLYSRLGSSERTAIEFFDGGHAINSVGTFQFLYKHLDWQRR